MKHGHSSATRLRQWREGESSPDTGNLSARPAGKPGFLFAKERLRRSLLRHCLVATAEHPEPSGCVFKAWRNLSGPMWFQNQNQTPGRGRAASRWSAPSPGKKRTRREDHAPSHRPQMSSGRLFLDRVARQHCPSSLHRHPDRKTVDELNERIYHRTVTVSFPPCLTHGVHPTYSCSCVFIRGPNRFLSALINEIRCLR